MLHVAAFYDHWSGFIIDNYFYHRILRRNLTNYSIIGELQHIHFLGHPVYTRWAISLLTTGKSSFYIGQRHRKYANYHNCIERSVIVSFLVHLLYMSKPFRPRRWSFFISTSNSIIVITVAWKGIGLSQKLSEKNPVIPSYKMYPQIFTTDWFSCCSNIT